MRSAGAQAKVAEFLGRYSREIEAQLRDARSALRSLFPRGYELVFDNYNALVFGISPAERSADAFVSVAGYPRWVTLFFLRGAELEDPHGLLQGAGKLVRGIRLTPMTQVNTPEVKALIRQAAFEHEAAFRGAPKLRTVVKTELDKRRPRRPEAKGPACCDRTGKGQTERESKLMPGEENACDSVYRLARRHWRVRLNAGEWRTVTSQPVASTCRAASPARLSVSRRRRGRTAPRAAGPAR